MALMCLMPLQSVDFTYLDETLEARESGSGPEDILLIGNSYVGSNSLHNLVDGVMNAASQPANVSTLNGGGMRLSQHASNVASAGHQWNTTLNNGNWNWVVLQDQSQIPGFPRSQQEWIDSKDGAVELAEVIEDNGAEVILMMTWGRRNGDSNNAWRFPDFSTMQDELEAGYTDFQDNISANGGHAWMAPVGLAFEHIHDKVVAEGGTPTNSGNLFYDLYSGDGSHPSLAGSYLAACVLYATITGDDPVGLSHTTSLSNSVVLELQQAAAATVFNETSHISYSWQTNSGGGNSGPSISIPANQTLAWESLITMGSTEHDYVVDVQVSPAGNVFILGSATSNFYVSQSCYLNHTQGSISPMPFVAKYDRNGTCIWLAFVDVSQANSSETVYLRGVDYAKIVIDSNENVYLSQVFNRVSSSAGLQFGSINHEYTGYYPNILAKIDHNGTWEWVVTVVDGTSMRSSQPSAIAIDQSDNLWITYQTGGYSNWVQVSKYNSSGVLQVSSDYYGTGSTAGAWGYDLDTDSFGNVYLAGTYTGTVDFSLKNGTIKTLSKACCRASFIAKFDTNASLLWVTEAASSSSDSHAINLELSGDEIFVIGHFFAEMTFNGSVIDAGGSQNGYLAKINSSGSWQWGKEIDCSCSVNPTGLHIDSSKNIYITGWSGNGVITFGNGVNLIPAGTNEDGYLAKFDYYGQVQWAKSFGGGSIDKGIAVHMDNQRNRLYVVGTFAGSAKFGSNVVMPAGGSDIFLASLSTDYDDDEIPDSTDLDDDGDFINDLLDSCHFSPLGFKSTGSIDHDSDGCHDEIEDDDDDNDQLNDTMDNCPKGMIGWLRTNSSDFDNDGCMDALEDYDDDNDGVDDFEDYCSRIPGNSTFEFEKGCPDADGDGRPDILDPFKDDPTEWSDTDGDGVGDNSDAFPTDATQQYDTDGDTYGDEEFGNAGDSCPTVFGNSTIDRYGCLDTDGDGWSDEGDDFPNDPAEHLDSDSDGYPDSSDDFPFDPTQWKDSDGDGYGDNPQGNLGDAYPNDPSRYADSDRDGIDDQSDAFPYDPTQWEDADGDGMGDNPMGIGADKFPNDPTQWGDIDGDGYGDNRTGNNPDAFPTDATQWSDMDKDGYGDNPAGRLYDLFPQNPTQWEDADGDGLGDNQSGTDADPYLNDFDNDGYNDTIDILPRFASPGDLDADGCLDEVDAFKDNALECLDTDGDGIGNNADADDDNDEWTDADEIRANTDPLDPNSTPVDSFEIQIGNIGLGAWDLIGIFGGVPIFAWIAFGFVTRNSRCARYEEQLNEANSRDELEQIALKWEYSLMLRLLGPHQGIRLERLRSELDDKFENAELLMAAEDFEPMTDIEQAPIVEAEEKDLPHIDLIPSIDIPPDQTDEFGFSWLKYNGENWYRGQGDSEWTKHEE